MRNWVWGMCLVFGLSPWCTFATSKVVEVTSDTHLILGGQPDEPWVVGEPVCLRRGAAEIGCGTVIHSHADKAEVQLESPYAGPEEGDTAHPLSKERRREWKSAHRASEVEETSTPYTPHFQLTTGVLVVPSYAEPMLMAEVLVSDNWSLGIKGAYLNASMGTTPVAGTSVMAVLTGYMRRHLQGVWLQLAAGQIAVSGGVAPQKLFTAKAEFGLRMLVTRSVRFGFGIAVNFIKNPVGIAGHPELRPGLVGDIAWCF